MGRLCGTPEKGSLVDIAILVTAVLLVAMLLAILIFSLLGRQKPAGRPARLPALVDAAESGYDKDANKIISSEFDGVILAETEDAGEEYVDNTLFIGDSNTYRMVAMGKTTWQNNPFCRGHGHRARHRLALHVFQRLFLAGDGGEAVKMMQPQRIIITYGTNNTAESTETFIQVVPYRAAADS